VGVIVGFVVPLDVIGRKTPDMRGRKQKAEGRKQKAESSRP
jgi:hypothetical protein